MSEGLQLVVHRAVSHSSQVGIVHALTACPMLLPYPMPISVTESS